MMIGPAPKRIIALYLVPPDLDEELLFRSEQVSMLALHLLQISLVCVNTLMIQRVLSESSWSGKLTPEDRRALTPLIYGHFNPYGVFRLDMDTRLAIDPAEASAA